MLSTEKMLRSYRHVYINKAALKKAESEVGCRYSSLLELPYFSPTRFLTIDPMHNLFLGTGKRVLSLWMDFNLVTKEHFNQIQTFTTLVSHQILVGFRRKSVLASRALNLININRG